MTSDSLARPMTGRVAANFTTWRERTRRMIRESVEIHAAEQELRRMSDRQLADIGLTPDDIGRAVRGRIPGRRPHYSW